MKAREIKKKLLQDYDDAIAEYNKVLKAQELRLHSEKVYIRVLEEQLKDIFGIEKKFIFDDEVPF